MAILKSTTNDTSHAHIDFSTPYTVRYKQTRLALFCINFQACAHSIEIELCRRQNKANFVVSFVMQNVLLHIFIALQI